MVSCFCGWSQYCPTVVDEVTCHRRRKYGHLLACPPRTCPPSSFHTCWQGRSHIQTYLHGQNGLGQDGPWSKLSPFPLHSHLFGNLESTLKDSHQYGYSWKQRRLQPGSYSRWPLPSKWTEKQRSHFIERAAGKEWGEGMRVLYRVVPPADISFLKLSFLLHLGSKGHPVTFQSRSPFSLCYRKSYSVTYRWKSSS